MASRMPADAAADYSDLDFLVFTQPGPQSDIPRVPVKVSEAATVAVHAQQSVLTLSARKSFDNFQWTASLIL